MIFSLSEKCQIAFIRQADSERVTGIIAAFIKKDH
jgi:hypothetical protein